MDPHWEILELIISKGDDYGASVAKLSWDTEFLHNSDFTRLSVSLDSEFISFHVHVHTFTRLSSLKTQPLLLYFFLSTVAKGHVYFQVQIFVFSGSHRTLIKLTICFFMVY